jgi:hypothetical protein
MRAQFWLRQWRKTSPAIYGPITRSKMVIFSILWTQSPASLARTHETTKYITQASRRSPAAWGGAESQEDILPGKFSREGVEKGLLTERNSRSKIAFKSSSRSLLDGARKTPGRSLCHHHWQGNGGKATGDVIGSH